MDQEYIKDFYPKPNQWHDYEIIWTPDYVAWELDGKEIRRISGTEDVHFLNKKCHIMMNYWVTSKGGWGEGFEPTAMPWYAEYDYVEVHKWNGNGFDFHWRDDFDKPLDKSRWISSNGWGYEETTFWPNQVGTHNGLMIITLNKPNGDEPE